jgi:hypothetical protein
MTLRSICSWFITLAIFLFLPLVSQAADDDITGWEVGSKYDKLYNPKEQDQIKGDIVKIVTITPLKGMAPGTALILDEGGGDEVTVHLCPESFASGRETGLRRGDWVKIRGAWADVGDETVFIASKVKKDSGFSFKVRLTSDGTPFWTLPEEQLAKERASE